jgi:hypothetical protein
MKDWRHDELDKGGKKGKPGEPRETGYERLSSFRSHGLERNGDRSMFRANLGNPGRV